jgi:hypothetical protein
VESVILCPYMCLQSPSSSSSIYHLDLSSSFITLSKCTMKKKKNAKAKKNCSTSFWLDLDLDLVPVFLVLHEDWLTLLKLCLEFLALTYSCSFFLFSKILIHNKIRSLSWGGLYEVYISTVFVSRLQQLVGHLRAMNLWNVKIEMWTWLPDARMPRLQNSKWPFLPVSATGPHVNLLTREEWIHEEVRTASHHAVLIYSSHKFPLIFVIRSTHLESWINLHCECL